MTQELVTDKPPLVGAEEVSRATGLHRRTVQRLAATGRIPAYRAAAGNTDRGGWRFDMAEVLEALRVTADEITGETETDEEEKR